LVRSVPKRPPSWLPVRPKVPPTTADKSASETGRRANSRTVRRETSGSDGNELEMGIEMERK